MLGTPWLHALSKPRSPSENLFWSQKDREAQIQPRLRKWIQILTTLSFQAAIPDSSPASVSKNTSIAEFSNAQLGVTELIPTFMSLWSCP